MRNKILLITSYAFLFLFLPSRTLSQWESLDLPFSLYIGGIAVQKDSVYVGTDSSVYFSPFNGDGWANLADSSFKKNIAVYSFAFTDSFFFVGTELNGIFRTSNNGRSWQKVSTGLPAGTQIFALLQTDSGLFAGMSGGGVYRSTNFGLSWQAANSGIASNTTWAVLLVPSDSGNDLLFAATSGLGVRRSTNYGGSWQSATTGITATTVYSLAMGEGRTLFAGTYGQGIFRSTDLGQSWQSVNSGLGDLRVQPLVTLPATEVIFAGTFGSGVFVSTNNGTSWTSIAGEELQRKEINAMAIGPNHLFAGVYRNGGVYRRPLSTIVSVDDSPLNLPKKFSLSQNYPNPFNPSTVISYELPVTGYVSLTIFNLLGEEVVTLVNERKEPGRYHVRWDAGNLPSGIYFYWMTAGSFRETKKLLLVR